MPKFLPLLHTPVFSFGEKRSEILATLGLRILSKALPFNAPPSGLTGLVVAAVS